MPPNLSAQHVLIVDDEADNIAVLRLVLQRYGAQVSIAHNGRDALALLETIQPLPTMVITDLAMPYMDGWELMRAMREDERWSSLPIVALTANVMPGYQQKALQSGFDGYVTKPFRVDHLLPFFKTVE
jgi:CheY-like chemotaxis protein